MLIVETLHTAVQLFVITTKTHTERDKKKVPSYLYKVGN